MADGGSSGRTLHGNNGCMPQRPVTVNPRSAPEFQTKEAESGAGALSITSARGTLPVRSLPTGLLGRGPPSSS